MPKKRNKTSALKLLKRKIHYVPTKSETLKLLSDWGNSYKGFQRVSILMAVINVFNFIFILSNTAIDATNPETIWRFYIFIPISIWIIRRLIFSWRTLNDNTSDEEIYSLEFINSFVNFYENSNASYKNQLINYEVITLRKNSKIFRFLIPLNWALEYLTGICIGAGLIFIMMSISQFSSSSLENHLKIISIGQYTFFFTVFCQLIRLIYKIPLKNFSIAVKLIQQNTSIHLDGINKKINIFNTQREVDYKKIPLLNSTLDSWYKLYYGFEFTQDNTNDLSNEILELMFTLEQLRNWFLIFQKLKHKLILEKITNKELSLKVNSFQELISNQIQKKEKEKKEDNMKWEVLLSMFSLCIAVFALLN